MVLVGIPYHKEKRYAINHVLDWAEQQTHKDVRILMNWHTGPYGEPGAIKRQFETFRRIALQTPATHLYIMEADTIPPLDALDRLLAHNKAVVGALYRYRSPDKPVVAWPKENVTAGLVEVDGMGTGAVLLSRRTLHLFSFFDWSAPDADYPMYDLLRGKGLKIYLDCDLVCKHYITEKEYA